MKDGLGISELTKYQENFHEYKIVVYSLFNCENIMRERNVDSAKPINPLFDEVTQHYHVVAILTRGMVKRYVCEVCNKCKYIVVHTS